MAAPLWIRLDEIGDNAALVCVTEEAVMGRDYRCDVVIHDAEASRVHARLTPNGSGWTIADLDTTNGTYVNMARIVGPAPLVVGDIVRIGRISCAIVAVPMFGQ